MSCNALEIKAIMTTCIVDVQVVDDVFHPLSCTWEVDGVCRFVFIALHAVESLSIVMLAARKMITQYD